MQSTIQLEKEMEKHMGRSEILQRTLPTKPKPAEAEPCLIPSI